MVETRDTVGGKGNKVGIERAGGLRNLGVEPRREDTDHAPETSEEDVIVDIGYKVPDFKLSDMDGKEHKLSDFRGSKVLLCFYEYTQCPRCAYAVGNLVGNYKKLAWATKLKVSAQCSVHQIP